MALECSIPPFLLQALEGQVMLACPVPSLEGFPDAKGSAWPWPNLDFVQQGEGTPCKAGNARC